LYASSEMLVDGFLELYRNGILRRKVYQHPGLQRLLNDGQISEEVKPATLDVVVQAGIISARLTPQDFVLLQEIGILRPELEYETDAIRLDDGTRIPANLADKDTKDEIGRRCLGTRLKGGHFIHACFFLG